MKKPTSTRTRRMNLLLFLLDKMGIKAEPIRNAHCDCGKRAIVQITANVKDPSTHSAKDITLPLCDLCALDELVVRLRPSKVDGQKAG